MSARKNWGVQSGYGSRKGGDGDRWVFRYHRRDNYETDTVLNRRKKRRDTRKSRRTCNSATEKKMVRKNAVKWEENIDFAGHGLSGWGGGEGGGGGGGIIFKGDEKNMASGPERRKNTKN
jgi:hypothetical protein